MKKNTNIENSDLFMKSVMESTTDGILVINNQGKVSLYNKKFVRMWKIPNYIIKSNQDKVLLKYVNNQLINPKQFLNIVNKLYKSPEKESFDTLMFKDGRIFERYSIPQKNSKRKIIGRVWNFRDVTESIKIQEKIIENEEKYRVLVENTMDYIYMIDSKYRIISVNTAAKKLLTRTTKDIIGKKVDQVFPKQIATGYMHSLKKVFDTGKFLISKNSKLLIGKKFSWLSVTLSPVKNKFGKVISVIGVSHDITSEIIAEEKLKENEEKLRKVFDNSAVGMSMVSLEGKWTEVNDALCNILGYKRSKLVNHSFLDYTLPDDIHKSKDLYNSLIHEEIGNGFLEKRYIHKNGRIIWAKLSVTLIKNIEGKPLYFVVITEDITDRKQLDEAKSSFLFLASHQLRTPLSITKWVLETLNHEEHLTPYQKEKFSELIYTNERLIKLINNILSVSMIDNGRLEINKKMVDIRQLILELVESLKKFAINKEKIIKITCPKKLKEIYCDPLLIREAITNLLINAINYSSNESEEIRIVVSERTNDYEVSIHNTGVMDSTLQEKINKYERFVRGVNAIDKQTAGSGLGLYITKKVIEANGGKIWFESNVKSGTTFYVAINKK